MLHSTNVFVMTIIIGVKHLRWTTDNLALITVMPDVFNFIIMNQIFQSKYQIACLLSIMVI